MVRFLLPGLVLAFILVIIIIIIFSVRVKLQQERQAEKVALESPVIGTPTDTGERAGRQLLPSHTRIVLKHSSILSLSLQMIT